ncbi:MAG: tRNA pseudouridine(38-40) synthase TruA [Gammaproteobacteria bacterium]|nr:tRNA pseudouridine(38-40) synthase TruA [Gammaproteobacteria bacterium]MBL6998230.1 tRNA pseudouridine(38-40) synthase TruA [Gammaproteobacteria bacterium]
MNYKLVLGIEYDGSAYCGWQRQIHCPSVQAELEKALSFVANQPIELFCAGRTDTGVHACEQIAHFETAVERSNRSWVLGANCRLPKDIRISWIHPSELDFHARFSAIARSYRYIIQNSAVPSALFHNKVSWEHRQLDDVIMHSAAQQLLGEHDFSAFRASGCQAHSPVRNIEFLNISRQGDLIYLDIKANAFLHHMVRNIAGSLMAIGQGQYSVDWLQDVLSSGDRRLAAKTASAAGLYFVQAFYPERFQLPQQERKPVLF